MRFLILAALVVLPLFLQGCATSGPVIPGTLEGVREEVHVDRAYFEDCPAPPLLVDNPRPSDVLEAKAADTKERNCLRSKLKAVQSVLKKAINYKE